MNYPGEYSAGGVKFRPLIHEIVKSLYRPGAGRATFFATSCRTSPFDPPAQQMSKKRPTKNAKNYLVLAKRKPKELSA